MSVEMEFRRHSVRDGAINEQMIGPQGYRLARLVGERQLRGRQFSHFFVSGLYRTHQTLAAFAEGAEDFDLTYAPPVAPLYIISPDTKILWRACREAQKKGEDLVEAAFATNAQIAEETVGLMAHIFKDWSNGFADGDRVLVIGHSPALELMLLGATGVKIPSLGSCEGFRIIKNGDATEVVHGTPDLVTSELKKILFK